MLDQRGINRGICAQCTGEEICKEFEKSKSTPFCGYCGCPPIKHKRVEILSEIHNNVNVENDDDVENFIDVPVKTEIAPSTSQATNFLEVEVTRGKISPVGTLTTKRNSLCSMIPELPQFSKCVENALNNGSIKGPLWSRMIMECASYYLDCNSFRTKTSYEQIGCKMFEKYPCIDGPGSKPWSKFTKSLSQKIRKQRMIKKNIKTSIIRKDFSAITNDTCSNEREPSDKNERTFFRSEASVASNLSDSEISEAKLKIATEWKKENVEKDLIKSLLRDTYCDRTILLKKGVSFETFLENYPCFKEDFYVLYEFSILLGRKKMVEASEKMKDFFQKVRNMNKTGTTEGNILLSDWLWIEKKCGIFQTKGEKSSPIIQVFMDPSEYHTKIQEVCNFPAGVILLEGEEIKDCAVVYGHNLITCRRLNVFSLLNVLLALYYILEIKYPKCFLQSMGVLSSYVLNHNCYQLGKRAYKVLRSLKNS